ncbi:MAG: cell division ATP-binding protein FtsE [Eubacteriales bacterium]
MIELNDVTKIYENGTVALDHVNLKIEDGEFVFIVGQSGAGKSTLLKLLLREETPTEGRILVDGEDLSKMKRRRIPYYRRKLGVVFQDFRLFPDKTVYGNVAFALRAVGAPASGIRRKVEATLRIVGLYDKMRCLPSQLSGGEQQRVALARALVNGPDIIIADEPTGNIDPKLSYEIMSLLVHIQQKRGKTVIVVTHERHLVDYFHQRVVTIHSGVVADDRIGGMFAPEDDPALAEKAEALATAAVTGESTENKESAQAAPTVPDEVH